MLSRVCNTFPCPDTIVTWEVGPWGPCLPDGSFNASTALPGTCVTAVHVRNRTVVCRSSSGAVAMDSACAPVKPPAMERCGLGDSEASATCLCLHDSDCGDLHRVCAPGSASSTSGACVCGRGWGGMDCTIPMSITVPCPEGVVDVDGQCCRGFVHAMTGKCCEGDGTVVDKDGLCCGVGVHLDACGVCGGTGVAVDVQGVCCSTPLPPSGVCCRSGALDDCGVCDGDNQCG